MNIRHIFPLLLLLFIFQPFSEAAAQKENSPDQLVARGKEFCRNGDFEYAALSWEQALSRLEPEKETGMYMNIVVHLAGAWQSLGHHQKSLKALRSALPVVEKAGNRYHKAQFFSALGDLHLSLGNADKADKYLEKALDHARLTKYPRLLTSILTDAGNLLATDGDYEGAFAVFTESLVFADQLKDEPELKADPLINILHVTSLAGDVQEIVAAYWQSALLASFLLGTVFVNRELDVMFDV